ncbi:MAG: 3-oxoacyl-[acyl-carrier-protein] reductase [Gemmatimonadetes bacterium]|jgi:3-oxoacyl-[acyl-carrier protein] reductase|nr:3-oxoacyl-[acyl-carrier-protein] reductase [Gemmatimonadota bacterium]
MTDQLADKVALVTGGGRGIGREICQVFAGEGARLAVADVVLETAQETVDLLPTEGLAVQMDVSDPESAQAGLGQVLDHFGKLDILINNAGITRDNLLMRMSEEEWDSVLDINLKGTFNCCKAAVRPMMKARQGRIISISSVVGVNGNPGQVNYSASKAGVIGLTKTLARELASRNITVNAVAPGFIETDMTAKLSEEARNSMLSQVPLARPGTPADVAGAVLFLASEQAAYITGQVIQVNGGMAM